MDVTTAASASLKFENLDFECFSKLQIPSNPVFFSFLIACLRCVLVKKKKKKKKKTDWLGVIITLNSMAYLKID